MPKDYIIYIGLTQCPYVRIERAPELGGGPYGSGIKIQRLDDDGNELPCLLMFTDSGADELIRAIKLQMNA